MPLARYWRSASECAGAQSVDCIRFLLPDASRHCEERGDEAIQPSASLDCFASLAITVSKLQPVETARPCAQSSSGRGGGVHTRLFLIFRNRCQALFRKIGIAFVSEIQKYGDM